MKYLSVVHLVPSFEIYSFGIKAVTLAKNEAPLAMRLPIVAPTPVIVKLKVYFVSVSFMLLPTIYIIIFAILRDFCMFS